MIPAVVEPVEVKRPSWLAFSCGRFDASTGSTTAFPLAERFGG